MDTIDAHRASVTLSKHCLCHYNGAWLAFVSFTLILRELIEKIEVFPVEGTGKDRTQRVIIHYRFVGTLDIPGIIHRPPYILDSRKVVAIEYLSNVV